MEYTIENLQKLFSKQKNYKFKIEEIKKIFNIHKEEGITRLLEDIKALEEEGIILEINDKYVKFPKDSNYILQKIKVDTLGYFYLNGIKYIIHSDDLNGALNNDLCVITLDKYQKMARVKKIIKRSRDLFICEIKNSQPSIYGISCPYRIIVNDCHTKKLKEGTRIMVKLKNSLKDHDLQGDLVEILGHKDDKDIDLKTIALSRHFNLEFNDKVEEELTTVPTAVSSEEIKERLDLRDELIYTIDCDNTKDIDDAVSIKINENGNYIVGVHIADVAHYVKQGSALFDEAYDRGTSLYMIDSVIPMLPKKLSNGICSLNPNVDRLTKSCIMEFDANGKMLNYKIVSSVINSKKKMRYSDVNRILENKDIVETYEPFVDNLILLNKFNKILNNKKNIRGYINFFSTELRIEVNENGFPIEFNIHEQRTAEGIIENLMILSNETVANHYSWLPFIYRVHDLPNDEKLREILDFLRVLGIKIQYIKNFSNPKTIQQLLKQLSELSEFPIISKHILRGMKKACYEIDNIGHFGLALDNYTHFTSPIRRLPDLLVHMLIDKYENCKEFNGKEIEELEQYLSKACRHASFKEREADAAEREADAMKMAEYMEKHIGDYFNGKIIDICVSGITIETKNHIIGHAKFSDIKNDFYNFIPDKFIIIGKRTKNIYKIGDIIRVKTKNASKELRTIDFEIHEKIICDKVKVLK